MSSSAHRLLFVLNEPGYFRMYGSTIVELERRGWDVSLAFDKPGKRGSGRDVPQGAGANVRSLGELPGSASPAARALRIGLDYVRYLEPAYADATYLRRRIEKYLPGSLAFLKNVRSLPRWVVSTIIALGRGVERLMPVNRDMFDFVRRVEAAAIVVSPVVIVGDSGLRETEVIKAGRALGVPVIVGAASWDHLTSKGLVRVIPDVLTVWNDTQASEAVELQRIPRERVVITGAQSLDHWFVPVDDSAVTAFRRTLAIDPYRRVVLFAGSSRKMAPGDSELRFVRRWLAALRASSRPVVRDAFVIVRPHPSNTDLWRDVSLDDSATIVYPTQYSGIPLSDAEVDTFRQSLLASAAVVGVNTTAMIEAAIHARPVLTVRDAEFEHSQGQTLHFGYLLVEAGGCTLTAPDLQAHVRQLEEVLGDPTPAVEAAARFVKSFVRPRGADRPATQNLCDVIENVATGKRRDIATAAVAEELVVARAQGRD